MEVLRSPREHTLTQNEVSVKAGADSRCRQQVRTIWPVRLVLSDLKKRRVMLEMAVSPQILGYAIDPQEDTPVPSEPNKIQKRVPIPRCLVDRGVALRDQEISRQGLQAGIRRSD